MMESGRALVSVNTRPLPSTRADKPQLSAYGDIATIEVDDNEQKQIFHVHKELLSFYSGYFRAALEGEWAESSSGVIKLETEDSLVFERFVFWLYTNKITDGALASSPDIMVNLWLFADRRDIPLVVNEMIDALHVDIARSWIMPTNQIENIYENTSEGSALRRMLMWSMSSTSDARILKAEFCVEKWPREALMDMLRLVMATRPAPVTSQVQCGKASMCPTYHIHEYGATCTNKTNK